MDTRFSDHIKSLENAKIPDDAIVKMLAKKGVIVTVDDVKAARTEALAAVQAAAELTHSKQSADEVIDQVTDVIEHGAETVAMVAAATGAAPVAAVATVVAEVAHAIDPIVEFVEELIERIQRRDPGDRDDKHARILRRVKAALDEPVSDDDDGSPAVVRAITKARVTGPDGKPMLIQFRGVYRDDLAKWLWTNHRSRVEPFPPRS